MTELQSNLGYTPVVNFPLAGTEPDLKFYYNSEWAKLVSTDDSLTFINIPITLDKELTPTKEIGTILLRKFAGPNAGKVKDDKFVIQFDESAGSGNIVFYDDNINNVEDTWTPNKTLTFQIIGGAGNYMFSKGFVTVKTTEDGGRYCEVFFFKGSTKYPDLRGRWNFFVKVLRLESPEDTLSFPTSYKFSSIDNCILSQDWDGDKRFIFLTLPANPPLRPTPGQQPGILTFVNGQLQIVFSDFDDNGVFTASVYRTDNEGNITKIQGLYTESGFGATAAQKPTIGEWTLERVTLG